MSSKGYFPAGECKHCHEVRPLRSRGLCQPCYKNMDIRKQYPSRYDKGPEGGEIAYLLDTGADPVYDKAPTLKALVAKIEKHLIATCVVWKRVGLVQKRTYTVAAVRIENRWTLYEMENHVIPVPDRP